MRYDLAVVGSGAAGFAAAIAARDTGRSVVVIEQGTVGGTCVNTGCVPSKALLAAADARHVALEQRFPGITTSVGAVDAAALHSATAGLVQGMRADKYVDLAADYGWTILSGVARFVDGPTLEVSLAVGGRERVEAEHYLVATGSTPWTPPIPGLVEAGYLTSTTAMELEELPASTIVLGGAAIGLELGQPALLLRRLTNPGPTTADATGFVRGETCMTSQDAQKLAALIRAQFGLHDLLPHLVRLLATAGEPVTVEYAAETGGFTVEQVRAELARHPGVDWNADGRIVGFGATLRPTPHRFTTDDGRTIYGFCASDALTYPVILACPGRIESTCPVTGQPVRVEVTPDRVVSADPETAVVSRIRPDAAVADVRAEICALGNFFASPHAAADWQAHHPHGALVPIAEDFEVNREAMVELGWTAAPV